jgi:hypothetical protein
VRTDRVRLWWMIESTRAVIVAARVGAFASEFLQWQATGLERWGKARFVRWVGRQYPGEERGEWVETPPAPEPLGTDEPGDWQ